MMMKNVRELNPLMTNSLETFTHISDPITIEPKKGEEEEEEEEEGNFILYTADSNIDIFCWKCLAIERLILTRMKISSPSIIDLV